MKNIVSNVAKYNSFSSSNLRSAYYQVPIVSEERVFSAVEADDRLFFRFKRKLFGLKSCCMLSASCKGDYFEAELQRRLRVPG